jgi:hypothetical protein
LWTSWKLAEKTPVQTRILGLAGLQQMSVGEASRLTDRADIQEVPRVAAAVQGADLAPYGVVQGEDRADLRPGRMMSAIVEAEVHLEAPAPRLTPMDM